VFRKLDDLDQPVDAAIVTTEDNKVNQIIITRILEKLDQELSSWS
jgi:hypothetical protein